MRVAVIDEMRKEDNREIKSRKTLMCLGRDSRHNAWTGNGKIAQITYDKLLIVPIQFKIMSQNPRKSSLPM